MKVPSKALIAAFSKSIIMVFGWYEGHKWRNLLINL